MYMAYFRDTAQTLELAQYSDLVHPELKGVELK